jgi:hypothetical protein
MGAPGRRGTLRKDPLTVAPGLRADRVLQAGRRGGIAPSSV